MTPYWALYEIMKFHLNELEETLEFIQLSSIEEAKKIAETSTDVCDEDIDIIADRYDFVSRRAIFANNNIYLIAMVSVFEDFLIRLCNLYIKKHPEIDQTPISTREKGDVPDTVKKFWKGKIKFDFGVNGWCTFKHFRLLRHIIVHCGSRYMSLEKEEQCMVTGDNLFWIETSQSMDGDKIIQKKERFYIQDHKCLSTFAHKMCLLAESLVVAIETGNPR